MREHIISIGRIIEAGRLAPSGENAQNVSYIVLKDNLKSCESMAVELLKKLLPMVRLVNPAAGDITIDDHFFFKGAPVAIMILSQNKIIGTLAASNMALMAQANGLGVLYSGFFPIAANISYFLKKALRLERGDKVVTTLSAGLFRSELLPYRPER